MLFNDLDYDAKDHFEIMFMQAYQMGYVDHEQGRPLDLINFSNDKCNQLAAKALNMAKVYMISYEALRKKERDAYLEKKRRHDANKARNLIW